MCIDLFKYDDGYTLIIRPPLVPEEWIGVALKRRDVDQKLKSFELDIRDLMELHENADAMHRLGRTEVQRRISDVRARADRGEGNTADLEFIRAQADDPEYPYRRTYLIDTLYRTGAREEALARVVALLHSDPKADDAEVALRLLSQWSPDLYAVEGPPFMLGTQGDPFMVQCWAITLAGSVLRTSGAGTLVGVLEAIARDVRASENVRYHAVRALAEGAGRIQDVRGQMDFKVDCVDLDELVSAVRSRQRARSETPT